MVANDDFEDVEVPAPAASQPEPSLEEKPDTSRGVTHELPDSRLQSAERSIKSPPATAAPSSAISPKEEEPPPTGSAKSPFEQKAVQQSHAIPKGEQKSKARKKIALPPAPEGSKPRPAKELPATDQKPPLAAQESERRLSAEANRTSRAQPNAAEPLVDSQQGPSSMQQDSVDLNAGRDAANSLYEKGKPHELGAGAPSATEKFAAGSSAVDDMVATEEVEAVSPTRSGDVDDKGGFGRRGADAQLAVLSAEPEPLTRPIENNRARSRLATASFPEDGPKAASDAPVEDPSSSAITAVGGNTEPKSAAKPRGFRPIPDSSVLFPAPGKRLPPRWSKYIFIIRQLGLWVRYITMPKTSSRPYGTIIVIAPWGWLF